MADTTALKNRIRAAIKANNNQEITGPVLQQALLDIVDELDLNPELENEAQQRQNGDSTLSGMINSETQRAQGAEQTIDGKASKALHNIENLELEDVTGSLVQATEMSIALRTNEGSEQDPKITTLDTLVISQATDEKAGLMNAATRGIYDVSKRNPTAGPNSDGKFTLDYILTNVNTLIPMSYRHPGMKISFADNSNVYLQYRYIGTDITADSFININNWVNDSSYQIAKLKCWTCIEHKYISPSGVLESLNEWNAYLCPIENITFKSISAKIFGTNSDHCCIAYYDKDFNLIGSLKNDGTKTSYTESDIVYPTGCKYIGFSEIQGHGNQYIIKTDVEYKGIIKYFIDTDKVLLSLSDTMSADHNSLHNNVLNFEFSVWKQKNYVNPAGQIGHFNNWNIYLVDVDIFTIETLSMQVQTPGRSDYSIFSYFDENMVFIPNTNLINNNAEKTAVTEADIVIPEGCRYMCISQYYNKLLTINLKYKESINERLISVKKDVSSLKNFDVQIAEKLSDINSVNHDAIKELENYYVTPRGVVFALSPWKITEVDILQKEIVSLSMNVQGPSGNNYSIFSYFDEDRNFIPNTNLINNNAEKTAVTEADIVIPEGCRYIYISEYRQDDKYLSITTRDIGMNGRLFNAEDKILNITTRDIGMNGRLFNAEDKILNFEAKLGLPDNNNAAYEIQPDYYVNPQGVVSALSSWKIYKVDVILYNIEKLSMNVQGPSGNNYSIFSYFDEDRNFIPNTNLINNNAEKTAVTEADIVIPEGCRYIYISEYYTKPLTIVTSRKNVNERLNKVENTTNKNTNDIKELQEQIQTVDSLSIYKNKKIAFCGDSITNGWEAYYQGYANRLVNSGLFKEAINVGRGGSNIAGVLSTQLPNVLSQMPDVDIISIATCTNNFSAGTPVGTSWYDVDSDGVRTYRTTGTDMIAYVNKIMAYISTNFPNAKVIWLTPIRKYNFFDGTIGSQGDDMRPKNGVYLTDYREMFMDIPKHYSAAVLDMWALSGLDPHIVGQQNSYYSGIRLSSGRPETFDGVHVGPSGGERMFQTYLGFLAGFIKETTN